MKVDIPNGAPRIIQLGTNDSSVKPIPVKPIIIGTHVPLVFGFTAGGPETKEIIDPGRFIRLYKEESFDRTKPYFTHATRLLERLMGAGNVIVFKRIIPEDNKNLANVTIYLDIIKDDVDVYKRNLDGSIAYDSNGEPIVDKTVKGYRLKLYGYVEQVGENEQELPPIGTMSAKPGYMTDSDNNPSTMYPIVQYRAKYKGRIFSNYGFTFHLPPEMEVNREYIKYNKAMSYKLYYFKRDDEKSTGRIIKNLYGSTASEFVLKRNAKSPLNNRSIELRDIDKEWWNLTDTLRDIVYPNFEEPYVYYDNLEAIQKQILEVEKDYINADVTCQDGTVVNTSNWLDFLTDTPVDEQWGIINVFHCMSTKRVPAFTYKIDDTDVNLPENIQEITLSKATPVWLKGGEDGTLTEETFEKGVREFMSKYVDPNSEVLNPARNIENVIYDSGFTIDTKKTLVNFITLRKDTVVGLSTRVDNLGTRKYVDLATERAIAITLKARFALAPESTYFGTGVARGFIVVGNGIDTLDPSERRYGLILDLATRLARMMGGQKWKRELMFDMGQKNYIKDFKDVQPSYIPEGIKADLWNIGVIWPDAYDHKSFFYPQLQTVYDIDASAMNNIFAAFALAVVNRVADATWRKFTGNITMGQAEFIDSVEKDMNKELDGKFGDILIARAKAIITDFDDKRGYSWTVRSDLGGEIMKTVMTHYIDFKQREELLNIK